MNPIKAESAQSSEPMKLQNVEDVYPLSPMQQGMLFHSLYEPGSGVYLIELGCRIDGKLDIPAFKRAWEEVIRRHTVLRTSFLWEGLNKPMQVVRQTVTLPWREEDWRGYSEPVQKDKWKDLLAADRRLGFDYKQPPLMRFVLVKIGEESYYFAWNCHHLLLDGWCRQIVLGEVLTIYEAYREGRKPELNRPRLYRDYIAWLQKQDESKAEIFWKKELKGFRTPTSLGIARERLELRKGEEERSKVAIQLPADVTAKLDELVRKRQVTLNAAVQAAWAILLSRYSGDKDVVYGGTVSGRLDTSAGFDEVVGLFINTLPVRAQVNGDEPVSHIINRLWDFQRRALEYEYSPLLKIQQWSDISPGVPLFESILVFENYPIDAAL